MTVEALVEKKKSLIKARATRTSIDALRAMASMQARPIPFLTTIGASTAIVGQIRYELPRTGDLSTRYDPVMIAKTYTTAGADAIAMFTDTVPEYDSNVDMTLVNDAMRPHDLPIIAQNYVVDEYNVIEARACGASVVTLTSGLVSAAKLRLLGSAIHRNRMTAIVDVFNAQQLQEALDWSPQVIGLSRSTPLGMFVDLDFVEHLREQVPDGQQVMITRPLFTMEDLRRVAGIKVNAVTVDNRLLLGSTPQELHAALRGMNGDAQDG